MWVVDSDTETIFRELLRKPQVVVPPSTQHVGVSKVSWWEGRAGDAVIMATGGSPDDRTLAEQIVLAQLEGCGYKRARFTFDSRYKVAGWPDIMQKAKRLIQSGQVTILRNGWNNIVGHVIGDHGEYTTEIGRDDPNSRTITTWQCECPWDQYAWQRTRKWKKYEGRPCAHVMALYWKALATPLDDYDPNQHGPMTPGQNQGPLSPSQGPPIPTGPGAPPTVDIPGNVPIENRSFDPSEAEGESAPMAAPGKPNILPTPPLDQLAQQMPPVPGQTPAGMPANPSIVSVPGAKVPSPFNPIQFPGGTYSATNLSPYIHTTTKEFQPNDILLPASETGHQSESQDIEGYDPNNVYFWHRRAITDPNGEDRSFPFIEGDNYPPEPRFYEIEPMGSVGIDPESQGLDNKFVEEMSKRNFPDEEDDNYPWEWEQEWYHPHLFVAPKARVIREIPEEDLYKHRFSKIAAEEFMPPEIVRLKDDAYGQAEGKSEMHGAGQYQTIPAGSTGEVLGQDPTTGWVEVIFPLEGGPLTPYHVRCFCEPTDLERSRQRPPGPFIRRR